MSVTYTIDISQNDDVSNTFLENSPQICHVEDDFKFMNVENIKTITNENIHNHYSRPVSKLARGWLPPPSPTRHKRHHNINKHSKQVNSEKFFNSDDENDFTNFGSGNVSENDFNDDCDFFISNNSNNSDIMDISYNMVSFASVRRQINKDYEPDMPNRYSSALDILASYLKGQKIIYMESRNVTVKLLNWFMLPSIFLSAACSVLSQSLLNTNYGPHILAAFNVMVACLIAIINYLKLDAASEAHKISAHQYDK